ncbi:MAG: mandelate racemase/muconate lactonizing enzyme family protein [Kiritimatiellia bacterium]
MKIVKVETIHFRCDKTATWEAAQGARRQAMPNNLWVRIHTDTGLAGLGETYYVPQAIEAVIHDVYAPLLIGREALDIENHWCNMFALVNFCGSAGAEMRALSAIDLALWDLAGQAAGQPIYNMLGGRSRDRIEIYNTCINSGPYDDYTLVSGGRAGEVAESLLKQGTRGMKIWPFDRFGATLAGPTDPCGKFFIWGGETAAGTLGHSLTNEDLRQGLSVIQDIRRTVGDRIAIAIEGHARWDLPTATRIARALEPYDVMWLEEIMPPDNVEAYVRLKAATSVRICQSERVFTRFGFRPWIERHAADIIMPDLSWCGGLTEGRKIASMADTYYLPVTCHDTIGPVALWAAAHLSLHIPNALNLETVRGYLEGWYGDVVTDRLPVADGFLSLPGKPGLGTRLRDDFVSRPDANIRITTEREIEGKGNR